MQPAIPRDTTPDIHDRRFNWLSMDGLLAEVYSIAMLSFHSVLSDFAIAIQAQLLGICPEIVSRFVL